MAEDRIYRQDDTNSFGQNWLQIDAEFPDDTWVVSRADIKIGNLPVKSYDSPTFPFYVNLTSAETAQLKDTENIYMAVYDSNGLKQTCEGTVSFKTRSRKV